MFLFFPFRWLNITGLHRATCPMKRPPIKPSSAPFLHRWVLHAAVQSTLCRSDWCVCAAHSDTDLCVFYHLQDTLAYATALLNEKEQSGSSNGSDGSPANENAERSLRQVAASNSRAVKVTHAVPAAKTRTMEQNRSSPSLLWVQFTTCSYQGWMLLIVPTQD